MNNLQSIHETVVKDIIEDIVDITKAVSDKTPRKHDKTSSITRMSSIAKSASALTAVFPVICSTSIDINAAMKITKAIERKCVNALQITFTAAQLTNAGNAFDYLKKFHTNLDDKASFEDFELALDSLSDITESTLIPLKYERLVNEDCRNNLNYYFEDDINESSLADFSVTSTDGTNIIKEADKYPIDKTTYYSDKLKYDVKKMHYDVKRNNDNDSYQRQKDSSDAYGRYLDSEYRKDRDNKTDKFNQDKFDYQKEKDEKGTGYDREKFNYQKSRDAEADKYRKERDSVTDKLNADKMEYQRRKDEREARKDERDDYNLETQKITNRLLPQEVKKSNEMNPTLMLINFRNSEGARENQAVIGVKAKLYPVSSDDIMNKIITKHADTHILLNFIRASTREISFAKDFLFAVDNAKLSAISNSKKPSSTIFRTLERRSLRGKIRKLVKAEDAIKCIATLVISKEEAETMQKYNHLDVTRERIIIPIMERLCLMYFIIVDQASETISLLEDGSTKYETYTFDSLDKDSGDFSYKKVVNLITKMAR